MYFRPRHRHSQYPLVQEHPLPRGLRFLLFVGAVIFAAYLLWTLVLKLLGISTLERAGAILTVEERGTVTVSIDGTDQRAEDGMLLFPGETVTTGPGAHASLEMFDGSKIRLQDGSTLALNESARGGDSRITLDLSTGSAYVMTAGQESYTGSIVRVITSPTLTFHLPPGTEAELSPTSIAVFATEGEGVTLSATGHDDFLISEGQQWTLPVGGTIGDNVYDHRSALDPQASRATFIVESRAKLMAVKPVHTTGSGAIASSTEILTVTAPAQGAVIREATVTVEGRVGDGVASVLVNGHPAVLDSIKHTFSQQVSPAAASGDIDIDVQALDSSRITIAQVHRTVMRGPAEALPAPTITSPAKSGETYQTNAEEFVLRGTAPTGAAGIIVNDYRLQLFDPAKGEWSYIASLRLHNLVAGTNTYDVYAIDGTGVKSPASRITIVQGQGDNGVVSSAGSSASSTSSGPLPTNAPLLPGTLSVTAPTPGASHTETGTGFLLEGTTSPQTATVWVNDYQLQLYRAGKTTWNYIAEVRLNNLKPGTNAYAIVARNKDGQILDQLTYTVEYKPTAQP